MTEWRIEDVLEARLAAASLAGAPLCVSTAAELATLRSINAR